MSKLSKFFKKLGKQIKTNLKHGAKYIVPVLVSALTGGFGSGIVQSLFGGKVAGALSNFGNKVFGGLLGKSSAGALPSSVTEGAKAVGEAVNSTGVPAVSTALGLAGGIPGISEITSQALSPVLGNSVTSGVLDAANTLVNKNAFLGGADKVLQNFTNTMALNGATGNAARKLYGEEALSGAVGGSGGGGGSSSYADKLELYSKLNPVLLGDEAKTVEVNPDNISLTEKKRFSSPTGEEQDEMRRIMQLAMRGDEKDKDKEEEEELKKYQFRQYVPMNYATGRRL